MGDTLNIEFEVPGRMTTRAQGNRTSSARQGQRRGRASALGKTACRWSRSKAAAGRRCRVIGWKNSAIAWRTCSQPATRKGKRVSRVDPPRLSALCDDLDQPRPPSFDKLAPLIQGFESLPEVELPKDLTATLRSYQKVGVDWLCFLRDAGLGAVLADDMGLGKTLQTLCAREAVARLIVCPKSVLHNWEAEAQAAFAPALKLAIYQGPRRDLDPKGGPHHHYLRHPAPRCRALGRGNLGHVWFWTRHRRSRTRIVKYRVLPMRLKANFPIALSGTPLENRLEELWSMFHFSHRGLLSGRSQFRDRYSLPIEQGQQEKARRAAREDQAVHLAALEA